MLCWLLEAEFARRLFKLIGFGFRVWPAVTVSAFVHCFTHNFRAIETSMKGVGIIIAGQAVEVDCEGHHPGDAKHLHSTSAEGSERQLIHLFAKEET